MKLPPTSRSLALACAGLAALCPLHAQPASDETVLFAFDDHAIPFAHNLQLTMEAPEKYDGNPVLALGPKGSPDEWQMNYYGTVLKIGDKYRMWYIAESKDGFVNGVSNKDFVLSGSRFAYAESADGIHWTKPDLGLMKFRGNKHNNLIGMPEGLYGYHALVRYEPEERDASRRYKMMALLWSGGAYTIPGLDKVGLIFVPFYSADGLSWRIADELLPNGGHTLSDKFHLISGVEGSGLYKWKDLYYLTGQSWGREGHASTVPYGRHVEIFHSPDLLHWSETQTMGFARQDEFRPPHRPDHKPPLPEDRDDPAYDNEQTHEGASVWVRGNVALGLTGLWHGSNDWHQITHDLGFIISDDGLHFREPDPEFVFAKVGERGRDWDYAGISQGQGFENVGDKTYIWYGGPMDQAEGPRTGTPFLRHGGVGLLILERDRFGSLSTRDPSADGSFVTNTVEIKPGQKVWVNVAGLGDVSRLRLEVLDPSERPLAGAPAAAVLTESGFRVPVAWPDGASLRPGRIRLKATFEGDERNGIQFYAIYLSP